MYGNNRIAQLLGEHKTSHHGVNSAGVAFDYEVVHATRMSRGARTLTSAHLMKWKLLRTWDDVRMGIINATMWVLHVKFDASALIEDSFDELAGIFDELYPDYSTREFNMIDTVATKWVGYMFDDATMRDVVEM